jgi:hypothetical protein
LIQSFSLIYFRIKEYEDIKIKTMDLLHNQNNEGVVKKKKIFFDEKKEEYYYKLDFSTPL